MVIMLFVKLALMKIAEIFTRKPYYLDYIKAKLRKRFDTKDITVDKDKNMVSFYLSIPQDLTIKDKYNTAKVFGLTLTSVKFVRINENLWKISFLSKGIQAVQTLIQSFPNLVQQIQTGKTVLDFEPKEEVFLNQEQKLRLRKEQKQIWSISTDISDYLMSVPLISDLLRQIYWNRHLFRKIFGYIPKDTNDIKILPWFLVCITLFYLFIYTFVFWATILCLLIAGYGLYKLKGVIKLKI